MYPMTTGKRALRSFLSRVGLDEKVRWTPIHSMYMKWRAADYRNVQRAERAFYGRLSAPGWRVFDIGANFGTKSETFLSLAAEVVALEPDARCVQALRKRFFFERKFRVVHAAVGSHCGKASFFRENPGSAYNTLSTKWRDERGLSATSSPTTIELTTLDALIETYGRPDFVKIDVEGFEAEVLQGLSTPVDVISFEANLPSFTDETMRCVDRLISLDASYRFNAVQDLQTGFLLPLWQTADEIKHFISTPALRYCEVFAVRGASRVAG
jgi:FkbM family methyltransferase